MKIQISNEKLLKALSLVASVAEKKQVMPILSYLHFAARDKRLTFIGTDSEVEITCHISLDQECPDMEGTIPARKFLNICRSFPADSTVEIAYEGSRFQISCGKSNFELSSLPPEDFPMMAAPAEEDKKIQLTIGKDVLRHHLTSVLPCMAHNDVRFYLNGVLFDFSETGLAMVATDGHRLAFSQHEAADLTKESTKCIVPMKGVNEILKLINNFEKEAELVFYSNFLQISGEDFSFGCKLIDAPFPDYTRVIPTKFNHQLEAEVSGLSEAFRRCAILAQDSGEKHHRVELSLSKGQLDLFSTNKNEEVVKDALPVEASGDDLKIRFNVFYLLDILSILGSGKVSMSFTDSNSSALLHKTDEDKTQFVVMPMKI